MAVEIITIMDLNNFRLELIMEIKQLLSTSQKPVKEWLKATEVRKLLNISPNTLVQLRSKGELSFSKLGGIYYYSMTDIEKLLERTRKRN